jgi:hypothetical protein
VVVEALASLADSQQVVVDNKEEVAVLVEEEEVDQTSLLSFSNR